ncbi:MAG: hypothetical protein R3C56_00355 [Pirellulaceae bacterium]
MLDELLAKHKHLPPQRAAAAHSPGGSWFAVRTISGMVHRDIVSQHDADKRR